MNNSEKLYRILEADLSSYILLWNEEDGWTKINEGGCPSLSRRLLDDGDIKSFLRLVHKDDLEVCRGFIKGLKKAPEVENPVKHRFDTMRLCSDDGEFVYYNIESDSLWLNKKKPEYIMIRIRETTAAEVYKLHLSEQSVMEKKNPKSWFPEKAKKCMLENPDGTYALIQFDIAKFKLVNEQFGEKFGDELLDYILQTLNMLCNERQFAIRLSADVFMVFTEYKTMQDIYDLINQITIRLDEYKGVRFRMVFGVSKIEDINKEMRFYGDNAALARQSIKNNFLSDIAFFKEELKENAHNRKFVEDRMVQALNDDEFVMYLQPKYSISQNKIIGAEALVRWISEERGMIPPMEFIPILEQNGFVIKMDACIWEQACRTIRKWIDEGKEPVPISVNMSRKHLRSVDFVTTLDHLVEKYQIDKQYLEIEITESASEEDMINGIHLLKQRGYTLLMDDFGSGYSSLNNLKDSKFDVLKIDRGFFQNFIASNRGQKIVEHIVKMTKAIGMDLIAEGVENKEQADFLSECGCDKVQGFYYGKPMGLQDFENRAYK